MFQAATKMVVNDGQSALFWTDNWLTKPASRVLRLLSIFAVIPRGRRRRTVASALQQRSWLRDIRGALTVQVLLDYIRVWSLVDEVILVPGVQDRMCWLWTSDQLYSAASAYGAMFVRSSRTHSARQLWKTSAPPKVKFFFWLVLHGRCWTAARRWRHGIQDSDECIFCDQAAETIERILLGCVYSREVWSVILDKLHLQYISWFLKRTLCPGGNDLGSLCPRLLGVAFVRKRVNPNGLSGAA